MTDSAFFAPPFRRTLLSGVRRSHVGERERVLILSESVVTETSVVIVLVLVLY